MADDKLDITSLVTDAIKAVTDSVAPAKKTAAKKPAKKAPKKTAKAADPDKHEETTGGGFTVKL